ncbi:hypothetical protein N7499_003061 [Penicillium canescens]|uniref:Uncharacterized protein n=1 Tax=Penicillium canescens TaxID=5083 RepID=A0AAD6N842_PENCN|nr:uncharacterized protein N7446_011935 [Penicillium canescens]KAJ6019830.1 hypothetical protein N7522_000538 [Penicillium canescens]KAJ6039129.1 hypothetical protein N7460_007161 [Penicillium canescens]KAJ6047101.1 hypothetical protein N7446_011935 [Penicillium canescens]KAJ6059851.1 hypothetical protein N7444_003490 [Penicillium canescens]KAJ6093730.1 hypothetical protein N7499_003061 [Penicillium canescens]
MAKSHYSSMTERRPVHVHSLHAILCQYEPYYLFVLCETQDSVTIDVSNIQINLGYPQEHLDYQDVPVYRCHMEGCTLVMINGLKICTSFGKKKLEYKVLSQLCRDEAQCGHANQW